MFPNNVSNYFLRSLINARKAKSPIDFLKQNLESNPHTAV